MWVILWRRSFRSVSVRKDEKTDTAVRVGFTPTVWRTTETLKNVLNNQQYKKYFYKNNIQCFSINVIPINWNKAEQCTTHRGVSYCHNRGYSVSVSGRINVSSRQLRCCDCHPGQGADPDIWSDRDTNCLRLRHSLLIKNERLHKHNRLNFS